MDKPAVLYVFGGEKAQGAEIVIERLMEYNSDNISPHLFLSPGTFADKLLEQQKPYPITLLPGLRKLNRSSTGSIKFYLKAIGNYFSLSYRVHQYIIKNNIRIVHANTIVPASYLLPLIAFSRALNRRVQWIWSDHDISYYSTLEQYLSKICAALYNNTLAVSNAVKSKYKPNTKVSVLYNGLDCDIFKPDETARSLFRNSLSLTNYSIVLGMAAVVHPRKGQLGLIMAFNELCKTFTNIVLLFAGGFEGSDPDYSKSVKDAISDNEKIIHLGYVDKMIDFYNGCDIIVNNSDLLGSEPLGTTIYEAMACEKIVIASATGGTPEIITDRYDGYLFEADNIDSLQKCLAGVLGTYNNLMPSRIAARETVKARFNIFNMAGHYNKLLTKVSHL
jgi:glycosyltransferase involved in cell wall biosynthesis